MEAESNPRAKRARRRPEAPGEVRAAIVTATGWARLEHVLQAYDLTDEWADKHLKGLPRRRQGLYQFVRIIDVQRAIGNFPPA